MQPVPETGIPPSIYRHIIDQMKSGLAHWATVELLLVLGLMMMHFKKHLGFLAQNGSGWVAVDLPPTFSQAHTSSTLPWKRL